MEERKWNNGGTCEGGSWTGGGGWKRSADGRRWRKTMMCGVGIYSCREYRRWWTEEIPSASSVSKKKKNSIVYVGVKI